MGVSGMGGSETKDHFQAGVLGETFSLMSHKHEDQDLFDELDCTHDD